jgi:hypothetical protein
MMPTAREHVMANGHAMPCQRESHGYCRTCDLIDRDGPHYREDYRRIFHPEEFPDAPPLPPPTVAPQSAGPAPAAVIDPERAALLARLGSCPFWIRMGCGCGENRCAAGRGVRGLVFASDCDACTL